MHIKSVFNGIFSYGAIEGVAKGLNIFSILMMSYFLETSVFGVVSLLIMFELLFLEMVLVGQHHAVLRYGASKNLYKTTFNGLFITSIFFIFWIIIVSIFVDSITSITKSLLILMLVAAFLQSCIQIILAFCRVSKVIIIYMFIRIGYQLVKLPVLYALIINGGDAKFYPKSVIISGLVVILMVGIFQFFSIAKIRFKNSENSANVKLNIKVGFPLGLHAISGVVYSFVDRIMINKLLDLESVGIYQLASTVGLSAFFIINIVSLYFTPLIYANCNDLFKAKNILNNFLYISLIGCLFISIIIYYLLINYIHLYDESYSCITSLFPYFLLVLLFYIINLYGLYGLTMLENVKIVPFITVLTLIIHMFLCQYFIPLLGIKGAIISLVISEFVKAFILFTQFTIMYKRKLRN